MKVEHSFMQSFKWDENFETNIKEVDDRHIYLINLVNKYGSLITRRNFSIEELRHVLNELSDYASFHFHEEEELMKCVGISLIHFREHQLAHEKFKSDLQEFLNLIELTSERLPKLLLDFLIQWLVYHILGCDQNMARQIKAIENGVDPLQAYQDEARQHDNAVGPLLSALKTLFEQVSESNKELIMLNQSLEKRVEIRTNELSIANNQLYQLSYFDFLTNLPNRRFAIEEVSKQWDLLESDQDSLVCMLIDIDKFKEINDTCGHDAGDTVLKKLAEVLSETFRKQDSVCRLGGDEFIVICPGLSLLQGVDLALFVHEQVKNIRIPYDSYCWQGSISVGVATNDSTTEDVSDLIKLADRSVYLAKSMGRNCIKSIQLT